MHTQCPFICALVHCMSTSCVLRHNYTQPLKHFSTQELCELAVELKMEYCISFFKQEKMVGEEMMLYTKEEFVSTLKTSTGEIFISVTFCTACLIQLLMHLSRSGVTNPKALLAWKRLRPYISSSKSAGAKKYVSPFCIVSF